MDRSLAILEGIYHKGQNKIWDGKKTLSDLNEKYKDRKIDSEKLNAIKNIFSVILHGEFAAWKISADLAMQIDDFQAKMAATSQAHDEARHYYVMDDYLKSINLQPNFPAKYTEKILNEVIGTKNLAKKLLGMQLMIEPIALTIFKFVRDSEVDPVLCDLLSYYEIDEARHVALGVYHLPIIIKQMNKLQLLDLFVWQSRILLAEIDAMRELEDDFKALGFSTEGVFRLAEKKQLEAVELMNEQLGLPNYIWMAIRGLVNFKYKMLGNA